MEQTLDVAWLDLIFFMLILTFPFLINKKLNLRLEKEMLISVFRMTLQLLLVGVYLEFLFDLNSLMLNIVWLIIMILVGSSAIISGANLPKQHLFLPVLIGLVISSLPLLFILLYFLIQPSPIFHAQYLIPLAGMLLGNSLSGNIVALKSLFTAFNDNKLDYETALSLGAQPAQAAHPFVQSAIKNALAPIIASMTTTGIVTLPGMMTGQILGGIEPITAVKYQLIILVSIFVMLCLSVSTSLYFTIKSVITPSGLIQIKSRE